MSKVIYTDTTPMPFGKYKGIRLIDINANYLLTLDEHLQPGPLKDYIETNREVLKFQARK